MATAEIETRGEKEVTSFFVADGGGDYLPMQIDATELTWEPVEGDVHVCRSWLTKESDGVYSAIAANLLGVCSQGDSLEEAKENLRNAFRAAIAEYNAAEMDIPWSAPEAVDRPANSIEAWIAVDA